MKLMSMGKEPLAGTEPENGSMERVDACPGAWQDDSMKLKCRGTDSLLRIVTVSVA
jgi:hypothetical protein